MQRELHLPFSDTPSAPSVNSTQAENSHHVPYALWRLLTDGVIGNWTHGANEGNDGGGEQYWPLGQCFL
jgi:hypothetical protein